MAAFAENQKNNRTEVEHPDRVVVTYYTDPLCCWSWAFESQWEKFRQAYRDQLDYRYVMGGMIADWKTFSDPINSVSSPAQMGPVWMHASTIAHVDIDYNIWRTDPPASSYPACIAVKNAFLQSQAAGELYLKAARHAVMVEQRNIARPAVLAALAEEVSQQHAGIFDLQTFLAPTSQATAREAFRADLQRVAYHKIGRFPTLTLVNAKGTGLITTGFRPFERLKECMDALMD
jgi:predicted DsbA family dithiol-disulfide isomerase